MHCATSLRFKLHDNPAATMRRC
ncbi:PTS transporter subunit EIIB [Serratia symbiotica]|nr:PTS transporter subunit EIIB [Serratia symbiotica]